LIPPDRLVLLDTGVLVLLARGGEAGRAVDAALGLTDRPERPLISHVTLAESLSLATKLGWGAARTRRLRDLFAQLVVVNIHQHGVLDSYVTLDRFTESEGRRMEKNDLWIAATAHALDAVLVTTDTDFDTVGESHITRILVDSRTGSVRGG